MKQKSNFDPTSPSRTAKIRDEKKAKEVATLPLQHQLFKERLEAPFQIWSSPEYRLKPPKDSDEIDAFIVVFKQGLSMRCILNSLYDAFGDTLFEKLERTIEIRLLKPTKLFKIRALLRQHFSSVGE